jgi:hypothetical protein
MTGGLLIDSVRNIGIPYLIRLSAVACEDNRELFLVPTGEMALDN